MSPKNVHTADERSRAITHSSDTFRTNTNNPTPSMCANFVIDAIEPRTRWRHTKVYSIAAQVECSRDYSKHRRLRMSLAADLMALLRTNDRISLTSPPNWVNRHPEFPNKANPINCGKCKCSTTSWTRHSRGCRDETRDDHELMMKFIKKNKRVKKCATLKFKWRKILFIA